MSEDLEPLEELLTHAHDTHIVVIGGGIAGLVAALECAKVGMRVTLLEKTSQLGGVIRSAEIAGVRIDLAAEGYSTKGGSVRALVSEVGLADRVIAPEPAATWIAGLPSGLVPAPGESVLGIPENAWDEKVRRIIGWRGSWRAYLDRLRPPLTIGQQRSLGRLVRARMGESVLERLVAPLSLGAFAIHPDDVDVDSAAPGLNTALTRSGSLSGAVAQVREGRKGTSAPAIEGLDGGMSLLVDALAARLVELEVDVRLDAPAGAILARSDGRWDVAVDAPVGSTDLVTSADPVISADAVIVALPEAHARELLATVAPALEPLSGPSADLEVLTLVVSSPELSAAPRRTAVYPLPGSSPASALTVASARWGRPRGTSDADATDRHVLRITFGGPVALSPVEPTTIALDDAEATALALKAASALLGVTLDQTHLRGSHRARYSQPRPVSALTQPTDAAAVRKALAAVPGIAAVGAWIAGTGLAQVVPDAVAEAERVRRAALWGGASK